MKASKRISPDFLCCFSRQARCSLENKMRLPCILPLPPCSCSLNERHQSRRSQYEPSRGGCKLAGSGCSFWITQTIWTCSPPSSRLFLQDTSCSQREPGICSELRG